MIPLCITLAICCKSLGERVKCTCWLVFNYSACRWKKARLLQHQINPIFQHPLRCVKTTQFPRSMQIMGLCFSVGMCCWGCLPVSSSGGFCVACTVLNRMEESLAVYLLFYLTACVRESLCMLLEELVWEGFITISLGVNETKSTQRAKYR